MQGLIVYPAITPPRHRNNLLTRPRLLQQMERLLDQRLILVSAPAGYGKSSLLIDFVHQSKLPICWYTIDPLDQDMRRFLAHFIAAISQRYPGFGEGSDGMLEQARLDLEYLVTVLVNQAYEDIQERFLIALDDFHYLDDQPDILAFVQRFAERMGDNCCLILASRSRPALPELGRMVGRAQVGGIDQHDLAFTAEDIQALAWQMHHVQLLDDAAAELASASEGWITGLLLSAHILKGDAAALLRQGRASGVGLYEYLASQVLDQQPEEMRQFLMYSSLLGEFNMALCEVVLRPTVYPHGADWDSLLEHLLQHNLFVTPVGEGGEWLRYHAQFQEFLQASLAKEAPQTRDLILCHLATYHAAQKNWDHAHALYRRLGDQVGEATIIEQAGASFIKGGRFSTLAQWLDEIPFDVLRSQPMLLSLQGVIAMVGQHTDQAIDVLTLAESGLRANGDLPGLARALARRSSANHFLGRYQASLEDAEEALGLAAEHSELLDLKAESLYLRGCNRHLFGQARQALADLHQAQAIYESLHDEHNLANVYYNLGLSHRYLGDFAAAEDAYEQSLAYWRKTHNHPRCADSLNNLGVLNNYLGRYERSAKLFQEGLRIAQEIKYARTEGSLLCCYGAIYVDLGLLETALENFARARQIAERIGQRQLLFYLDQTEAAIAMSSGDFVQAHTLLAAAEARLQDNGCVYEQGRLCQSEGRLALAEGEAAKAREWLSQAIQHFSRGEWCAETARSHLFLAQAYDWLGDENAMQEHIRLTFQRIRKPEYLHVLVTMAGEVAPLLEKHQNIPDVAAQMEILRQRVAQFQQRIPTMQRRLQQLDPAICAQPPWLVVRALGDTLVQINNGDGYALAWEKQLDQEVFFYLLNHKRALSSGEIADTFWPKLKPKQRSARVHNTVYRLRAALLDKDKDIVLHNGKGYCFNRQIDYEYDVEQFVTLIEAARHTADPQERAVQYSEAVVWYGGAYLPNAEGNWALLDREYMRQAYTEGMLYLSEYNLQKQVFHLAMEYILELLKHEPCLEPAYCQAMLIQAKQGNRPAIVQFYNRCCQILKSVLKITPSSQTEELYKTLIQ